MLLDKSGIHAPEVLIDGVTYQGPHGNEKVVQKIFWAPLIEQRNITFAMFAAWPTRWGTRNATGAYEFDFIDHKEIYKAQRIRGDALESVPLRPVLRPLLRGLADNGFDTLIVQGSRLSGARFGGKLSDAPIGISHRYDLTRYRTANRPDDGD